MYGEKDDLQYTNTYFIINENSLWEIVVGKPFANNSQFWESGQLDSQFDDEAT